MSEDSAMELIKSIRRDRPVFHEYLCRACAHRDHGECEGPCTYCGTECGCVCRRWQIPVEAVEKE